MIRLIAFAVVRILELMELAILIRAVISWIPVNKDGQWMRILYQITEPVLSPIRQLIERSALGKNMVTIDFSPIIAFLLIGFIKNIIARMFYIGSWLF